MSEQPTSDDTPEEPPPEDRGRITPRLALLASIAVLAAVIGTIVGAIFIFADGDTDSVLTEYFEAVEALVNDIDDRNGEGAVSLPSDVFVKWAVVSLDTATQLDAIEPPPEAADAHAELVAAINGAGVILAGFPEEHSDVGSIEEAIGLISEDEGAVAADARARKACAELQKLADENEVKLPTSSGGERPVDFELC